MTHRVFIAWVLPLAVLVFLLLLARLASADPVVYQVEDLGVLPGTYPASVPTGINAQGQVVGWSGSYPTVAFLYTDGVGMVALPNLAGEPWGCTASDINDAGEVTGVCDRAVRWSAEGIPQALEGLGGGVASASALNEAGMVVGNSTAPGQFLSQAFLYTDGGGMVDLTPGNGLSTASDINDRTAGVQITGWDNSVAFRWENGVLISLGAPAGYLYSFGDGINDAGTVVGSAKFLHDEGSSFARYTDGSGWELFPRLGRFNSFAAVNNAGVIVGTTRPDNGTGDFGVVYTDETGLRNLNNLIDSPSVWSIVGAFDINDAGQIAAQGMNRQTGEFHAVRLTPITSIAGQLFLPLLHK